jgi:hypothetical protein
MESTGEVVWAQIQRLLTHPRIKAGVCLLREIYARTGDPVNILAKWSALKRNSVRNHHNTCVLTRQKKLYPYRMLQETLVGLLLGK